MWLSCWTPCRDRICLWQHAENFSIQLWHQCVLRRCPAISYFKRHRISLILSLMLMLSLILSLMLMLSSPLGLRARAIAFIHIHQPLRVSTKSNKYGGGKAPKQAHMLPIWQRLLQVAQDMQRDPEFLLTPDYFVFDDISGSITNSCKHYRETKVCVSETGTKISHIHDCTPPNLFDRPTVSWWRNYLRMQQLREMWPSPCSSNTAQQCRWL